MKIKKKNAVMIGVGIVLAVLLAACLTDLPEETVTVTFNSQGGTAVASVELVRGGTLGGSFVTPARGDDLFLGWFSGFDRFYADTVINTDTALEARWRGSDVVIEFVEITFSAPGAIPPLTVINIPVDSAVGPLFPINPRLRGNWFDGWEANGVPFTNTSIVTEDITVTADWSPRDEFRVLLWLPEAQRAVNVVEGVTPHLREFTVFEGESIIDVPNWQDYFPLELNTAADPNPHQFFEFFRWAAGAGINGLIVDQYTPFVHDIAGIINNSGTGNNPQPLPSEVPLADRAALNIGPGDILLGAFYGEFFHPVYFDVDLSTFGALRPHPATGAAGHPNPRNMGNNAPNQQIENDNFRVTIDRFNAQFWFHTPGVIVNATGGPGAAWGSTVEPDSLRDLLNSATVPNQTQFQFEIDYEFVVPTGGWCDCNPALGIRWECHACNVVVTSEAGIQVPPALCPDCGPTGNFGTAIHFRRECERRLDPNNSNNTFNVMIANVRGTDNWNAVEVIDLTLDEINNGVFNELTLEVEPAIHNLAPTHASNAGLGSGGAGWNRNWVYFRAGRGQDVNMEGPFDLIISGMRIHIVQ